MQKEADLGVDAVELVEILPVTHGPKVGTYAGIWTGYNVEFETVDEHRPGGIAWWRVRLETGVRGIKVPCIVTVHSTGIRVRQVNGY